MLDAVELGLLLIIMAANWVSLSQLHRRTEKLMSGLSNLQAAIAANTQATTAAVAALQSGSGGGVPDSELQSLADTLTANNTTLSQAVTAFQGGGSNALTISTAPLPDALVNTAYTGSISVTGGVSPYSVTVSGLPDGLTDNGGGSFSGTPTTAGTSSLSVSASDSSVPPQTTSATLTLVVDAATPLV